MHSGDPRDVRQCRESNPALSSGLPLLSEGDHRDQNYMRVIIVNRIVLKWFNDEDVDYLDQSLHCQVVCCGFLQMICSRNSFCSTTTTTTTTTTTLTSMTMVPPCAIVSRPIEVVSMGTAEDHKALWEGFREFWGFRGSLWFWQRWGRHLWHLEQVKYQPWVTAGWTPLWGQRAGGLRLAPDHPILQHINLFSNYIKITSSTLLSLGAGRGLRCWGRWTTKRMRRRRWATAQPECRRCCQPASRRMRRASRWTTKQSSADLLLHTLMRRPSGSSNGCRESREQRGGRSDRRCLLGFDARLETGGLQTCRQLWWWTRYGNAKSFFSSTICSPK